MTGKDWYKEADLPILNVTCARGRAGSNSAIIDGKSFSSKINDFSDKLRKADEHRLQHEGKSAI